MGDYVWKGGDLVRIDPEVDSLGMDNPVVKREIDPSDREALETFEMTNVVTDHPLTPRLILCLKGGRNVDPFKQKIFFGKDDYGIVG
jgi:hypothetical protein